MKCNQVDKRRNSRHGHRKRKEILTIKEIKVKNIFKKKKRIYISIKTQQLQEQRQDQNVDTQGTLNNEKGDTPYYNTSVREKDKKKTNIRRAFVLLACLLAS